MLEARLVVHKERARRLRTNHEKAMDYARERNQEQIGFYQTPAKDTEQRKLVANKQHKVAEVDLAKQLTLVVATLTEHKH